jgi:predicted ester cyclase
MTDPRAALHARLLALNDAPAAARAGLLDALCLPGARWRIAHPVGECAGAAAVESAWLAPLHAAIPQPMRRDEIVMGGTSRIGSGEWVATLGHYVGNFERDLFGVPAHGKLVFLRCGEFYRLEEGRIAEAVILFDLLDLARQAGLRLPQQLGAEGLFPGPATHDGVLPAAPERSSASFDLVQAMLADLRTFDPVTFDSRGQSGPGGYWDARMLWHGPGGVGANCTYPGFQRDHRIPFLTAFPDRMGGNHFARLADGDYVCAGGWPSMTMTHRGPYLGIAPSGEPRTLRVMDFWRCAGGRIMENWVLIDLADFARQCGVDVIAQARAAGV